MTSHIDHHDAAGKPPRAPRKPRAAASAPQEPPPRKAVGFLHAAAMMRKPVAGAFGKRGFAEPAVLAHWPEIVGESLAAHCRPVKISYAAGGMGATLIVLVPGARAPEVEMQAPRIIERINAMYGYRAVSRVKVTQVAPDAPAGMAEEPAAFARARRLMAARRLPPEKARDLARTVAPVQDERLRAALELLGRNVSARALGLGAKPASPAAAPRPGAEGQRPAAAPSPGAPGPKPGPKPDLRSGPKPARAGRGSEGEGGF
ncbi:DUF721 domain-containing protein [Oceanicella actignis]|uniref:DUF721 domain-containing protein n=1 Tax=Oceanicella actignis TaxID=1189325 RepID=UPI001254311B|nr:DUF721 domain-containing protein [Oceanicella actignis]TYO85450.1 hypothetical protein LY05_02561 [Oceanicella actignis]